MPVSSNNSSHISVILPVFNNAETLDELQRRLSSILRQNYPHHEIIYIDDASQDQSLNILKRICQKDSRVRLLKLTNNVGQQRAILLGIRQARGNKIIVLDADLQDPPEAIPDLIEKLNDGYDAVFGGRRGRYESIFRLISSRIFKSLLHLICGVPSDAGVFVVLSREMTDKLLSFQIRHPFLVAMIGLTDLPTTSIPVKRSRRHTGNSGYSSWQRLRIGLSALSLAVIWKWFSNQRMSLQEENLPEFIEYISTGADLDERSNLLNAT